MLSKLKNELNNLNLIKQLFLSPNKYSTSITHYNISIILLLVMSQTGCQKDLQSNPDLDIKTQPTYIQIAEKQNFRVNLIKSYWSRSSFEIKWYDENKDNHNEIGEGHLIMIKPDRIALTFTKLGEIYSWAGCNDQLFWLFEGGDNPKVYVARNENAFTEKCAELPISVHPLELLDLLCFFDFQLIDTTDDSSNKLFYQILPDNNKAMWTLIIPARWSNQKIYFDPETLLPSRIELLSKYNNEILVTADLSQYIKMEVQGVSLGNLPKVPAWVVINDLRSDTTLRLALRSPSDQTATKGPVREAMFDFDVIKRKMRPAEYIILDQESQNPALDPTK